MKYSVKKVTITALHESTHRSCRLCQAMTVGG